MRLQHLALFRGIGLGACAVNLGMPSTCLAPDRLWRLRFDHLGVTVEVAPVFPLRFPNVALRQSRILPSVNLRKSRDP